MSPNERSEYSMTNTSPRRENVESPRMYTRTCIPYSVMYYLVVYSPRTQNQNGERERRESQTREEAGSLGSNTRT